MNNSRVGMAGKRALMLLAAALMLLATACSETAYTPGVGMAAPVVTSSSLQATVDAAQVQRYLEAIEAEDTLRLYHAQGTATAEARLTQEREAARLAQERQAQATATAWQLTVEAQQAAATATALAQAGAATATAQAQAATATAEARKQEAEARMTAEAWAATMTAVADEQAAVAAIRAEQVERERLATQRERIIYPVKAFGPWVLAIAALVVLLWGLFRFIGAAEMQLRAVRRDSRGDAPLLIMQQGRHLMVYDADRSPGAAITMLNGAIEQPALADAEAQGMVTARDQAIDMAHRGLPAQTRPPGLAKAATLAAAPLYRILPAGQRPPAQVVDAHVMNALEADWREA